MTDPKPYTVEVYIGEAAYDDLPTWLRNAVTDGLTRLGAEPLPQTARLIVTGGTP